MHSSIVRIFFPLLQVISIVSAYQCSPTSGWNVEKSQEENFSNEKKKKKRRDLSHKAQESSLIRLYWNGV